LNLAQYLRAHGHPNARTAEELAILGEILDDAEVARRIGRSANAVRGKRNRLRLSGQRAGQIEVLVICLDGA
jgi:hypothetical protein